MAYERSISVRSRSILPAEKSRRSANEKSGRAASKADQRPGLFARERGYRQRSQGLPSDKSRLSSLSRKWPSSVRSLWNTSNTVMRQRDYLRGATRRYTCRISGRKRWSFFNSRPATTSWKVKAREQEIDNLICHDIARREVPPFEKWYIRRRAQQAVLPFGPERPAAGHCKYVSPQKTQRSDRLHTRGRLAATRDIRVMRVMF